MQEIKELLSDTKAQYVELLEQLKRIEEMLNSEEDQ